MKWYAFNDDDKSSTVNVILDHNITAIVAWNSTGSNIKMTYNLKTDTSTWKSDLNPRLIEANEIAKITGNTGWDASKENQKYFFFDSNNQTLTTNSTNKSKYAWLFDYTNGCTGCGCNKEDSSTSGYWTSSPVKGDLSAAWSVRSGALISTYVASTYSGFGIRPVITISKSNV